jgi:hypothetical protein
MAQAIPDVNREVENVLKQCVVRRCVGDATVSDFLILSGPKLENFIHARKFDGCKAVSRIHSK